MTNSACNYNANTYDQKLNIYFVQAVIFVKSIYHETILFSYLWFSQNHIFRDKALWFWPLDILTLNKSVKALSLATFSRQRRVGLDNAGYLEEWPYGEFWPEHSTVHQQLERRRTYGDRYTCHCVWWSVPIVFTALYVHARVTPPHRWTCHCVWCSLFPLYGRRRYTFTWSRVPRSPIGERAIVFDPHCSQFASIKDVRGSHVER